MPRRFFLMGWWVLWGVMAMQITGAGASSLVIDPHKQWQYAQQLLENGRFRQSAEEFERFAFFFPNHPERRNAVLAAGRAHMLAGDRGEALQNFNSLLRDGVTDPVAVDAFFLSAETYMMLGNPREAIMLLTHLIALTDDPVVADRARLRIGWIHFEQTDRTGTRHAWGQISPEGRRTYRVEALETALDQADHLPRKNPTLAGVLSIVPGTGQLYVGRYQDAMAALIVNGGLFWAAYDSFDNGLNGLGGLLTLVGVGFYTANIYGAVSSAHKFNQDQQRGFVEQLKRNASLSLAPAGSAPSAKALLLKWQFLF
jgi:tetratricopeptide (TPR) repeat protein